MRFSPSTLLIPSATFHKCPIIIYTSFSSPNRVISTNDSAVILEKAVALCRLNGLKLLQGFPAVEFTSTFTLLQIVSVSSEIGKTQPSELSSPFPTGHAVHFTLSFPALFDPPNNTQSHGTNGPPLETTPPL